MTHKTLCYLLAILCLAGILPLKPAIAGTLTPSIQAIFSPSEFTRKATDAIERLKEGLHPVLVVLLYAGIVIVALVAFAFAVMLFFMVIMTLLRR